VQTSPRPCDAWPAGRKSRHQKSGPWTDCSSYAAPLTMALGVQGNPGLRPIGVISLAASGLLVVFCSCRNTSFLLAIVAVFAWITAVAVRLATYTS
jgi:hypothetical protein